MEMVVDRKWKKPDYVIGQMFIDGEYVCDTLEDTDRGLDQSMKEITIRRDKVYGRTAIPTGKYKIDMDTVSPRFGKVSFYKEVCDGKVPRVMDVKGFDGVLLHSGNDASDSSGCVLLGQNKAKGKVLNSRVAFKKVYAILKNAHDAGEEIWLTIK